MKKTQVAFQMSTERLAKRGRLYFWTFTFKAVLDIEDTRNRWNYLLTLMRKRWPKMCGLRVFEMHKTHGLHVHLLTDAYLDVNAARSMASKAGWGRIHVERIPESKAGYLGKYLSKAGMFQALAALGGVRKSLDLDEGRESRKELGFLPGLPPLQEPSELGGQRGFLLQGKNRFPGIGTIRPIRA